MLRNHNYNLDPITADRPGICHGIVPCARLARADSQRARARRPKPFYAFIQRAETIIQSVFGACACVRSPHAFVHSVHIIRRFSEYINH